MFVLPEKCSIFVTQLKQSAGVAQRLVFQQINYARVAQLVRVPVFQIN